MKNTFAVVPVPLPGEFGPPTDSLVPDDWEVSETRKVLGDRDGGLQVKDNMPPAT